MDYTEQLRGMVITTARPQDPALQGWTPHIPSQPRLNSYLDLFNDADIAAQRATDIPVTDEKMINVGMPLAWHFEPAPDGWSLGGIQIGEEALPPQPSMFHRMRLGLTVSPAATKMQQAQQQAAQSVSDQMTPPLSTSPTCPTCPTCPPPPACPTCPVVTMPSMPTLPGTPAQQSSSWPWLLLALGVGYYVMR